MKTVKKYENFILPTVFALLTFGLMAYCFDFYYDLNDDVVMKDILSGAFTGTPDGHNIQMQYPISWLISIFYRAVPQIPWYGLFLCAVVMGCMIIIGKRSLDLLENRYGIGVGTKLVVITIELLSFLALYGWELIYVQYTVITALLCATAGFLFFTNEKQNDIKEILKQNLITIFLAVLAFNIRSEMFLLMCPFLGAIGLWRILEEKQFSKETFYKYIAFLMPIFLGIVATILVHSLAYGSKPWKDFQAFFDARTQVYDYTWYPSYEEHQDFYDENGISKTQYELIDSYNFALDPRITTETLETIAAYQKQESAKQNFTVRLVTGIKEYTYRILHQDQPYTYFMFLGYCLVILLFWWQKEYWSIGKMLILLALRSVSWMYVILAKRVPIRISHSLYLIEWILLAAIVLRILTTENVNRKLNIDLIASYIAFGFVAVLSITILPGMLKQIQAEQQTRMELNEPKNALEEYASEHPDDFFYLDVYSSVTYSDKMFGKKDSAYKNYNILGGWAYPSPLYAKACDLEEKPILQQLKDNKKQAYLVVEEGGNPDFIVHAYQDLGEQISLELVTKLDGSTQVLCIYHIV
ncbi:MAG: hypothetical protein MJ134_09825 [Lachnospiraceae bacterium]|nr:hypothetical protein [Lachnospiraceae bacterium]